MIQIHDCLSYHSNKQTNKQTNRKTAVKTVPPPILTMKAVSPWLRGPAVEHWSLADVLSLSCARLVADG